MHKPELLRGAWHHSKYDPGGDFTSTRERFPVHESHNKAHSGIKAPTLCSLNQSPIRFSRAASLTRGILTLCEVCDQHFISQPVIYTHCVTVTMGNISFPFFSYFEVYSDTSPLSIQVDNSPLLPFRAFSKRADSFTRTVRTSH